MNNLGVATIKVEDSCFEHNKVDCEICDKYVETRTKGEILGQCANEFLGKFYEFQARVMCFQNLFLKYSPLNNATKEQFEELEELYDDITSSADILRYRYNYYGQGKEDEKT